MVRCGVHHAQGLADTCVGQATQQAWWKDALASWHAMLPLTEKDAATAGADRRFRGPQWEQPLFDAIRQSYVAIAEQLGMQERTLRRRLAAEETSYGAIVDDVRRKLTIEYLQTTRMSVDDIAWKVGFSDSTNLRRAVRRWTGKTISALRAST